MHVCVCLCVLYVQAEADCKLFEIIQMLQLEMANIVLNKWHQILLPYHAQMEKILPKDSKCQCIQRGFWET